MSRSLPRIPLRPAHPERVCWGCDKYCPANDLSCGNGTVRTQHPVELFGEDWLEWANDAGKDATVPDSVSSETEISQTGCVLEYPKGNGALEQ